MSHLTIPKLQKKLEDIVETELGDDLLERTLKIDAQIPLASATFDLWRGISALAPFGIGNPEPVFATKGVKILDIRLVGADGKHLKLRLTDGVSKTIMEAIAFNFGHLSGACPPGQVIDLVYALDLNVWKGNENLQLKVKDINAEALAVDESKK